MARRKTHIKRCVNTEDYTRKHIPIKLIHEEPLIFENYYNNILGFLLSKGGNLIMVCKFIHSNTFLKNYLIGMIVLFLVLATVCFAEKAGEPTDAGNMTITGSGNLDGPPAVRNMKPSTWTATSQESDTPGLINVPAKTGTSEPFLLDIATASVIDGSTDDLAFWAQLEAFDDYDKANAVIQFETREGISPSELQTVKNAENSWNSSDFNSAIDAIRLLENAGILAALGINWKVPKTIVSPNWMTTDQRIGTRTDIYATHLDFDTQNGNLFAVLKYRNGSATKWYWSVNISTDKGKTWQETYEWWSNSTIKDIGAAVAGNYLWVGYTYLSNEEKALMRRFSVADGASDSIYGFKEIFDKDRPIKEIAISANADSYDNRVYYSAILDNSTLSTAVEATDSALTVNTQPLSEPIIISISDDSSAMIRQLAANPKLKAEELILDDFRQGMITTRVIINLNDPNRQATASAMENFKKDAVRKRVRQRVETALNKIIGDMDPNECVVTNRFTYVFGLSAEVTVKGLASLVNHLDVISINKDGIRNPHLAQGIPLINASTVRSTYNGTGMAIAICDTGVDYTHARLGNGGFPNSKVIGGYDTGENDDNPMDEQGHGTSCAGIAAGSLGTSGDYIGGVAYNAKIYALKMSRADINHSARDSDMIEAWEWCVTHQNDDPANPIMIISTSFGGGYFTSQAASDAYNAIMTTAAATAKAAGITLFVSTGNDGFCDGTGWPGGISHVVGVGAVYDADIGRNPGAGYVGCIGTDSCVGYTAGCPCDSGNCYVDETTAADQVTTYSSSASFMELFAPSNDTYTTALGGGYRDDFGGTSAACPYAAGAAACLQSAAKANTGSYLTPALVQSTLISTGDSVTDPKASITKPRVNLGNAVATVASDNLVFYYAYDINTPSPSWVQIDTGVTNALSGLDATFNTNFTEYGNYLSYIASENSDVPVMIWRVNDFGVRDIVEIFSNYTGNSYTTSVSAYKDTVICAFEDRPDVYNRIAYMISYTGGDTWSFGDFVSATSSYYSPAVTCRGGKGSAIVFQEEAGAFDPVWFKYRNHYSPGAWDTADQQINELDIMTGTPNTIQWLPPFSGGAWSYGSIYIENSRLPYFDRSDGNKPLPIGVIQLLLLDDE